MDNDEIYNGWPNRETWALNLHLNNDEGLYRFVMSLADQATDTYVLADCLKQLVDDWRYSIREGEPVDPVIQMLVHEVGSAWRVDWSIVARYIMEE